MFGFSAGRAQSRSSAARSRDVLAGTRRDEGFHPGGGLDRVTTGGGADTIFFDDRAGQRETS